MYIIIIFLFQILLGIFLRSNNTSAPQKTDAMIFTSDTIFLDRIYKSLVYDVLTEYPYYKNLYVSSKMAMKLLVPSSYLKNGLLCGIYINLERFS